MSNLWLNIRIGLYHLQAGSPNWYSFKFGKNYLHKGYPFGFFEVYTLFKYKKGGL